MKWLAVALGLITASVFGRVFQGNQKVLRWIAILIGIAPFLDFHLNPISFELYRGDARGLEFTVADFLAVALWFALPSAPIRPYFRVPRALYLLIAIFSISQAPMPLFAMFGVFKIIRIYILCAVVVRGTETANLGPEFIRGLGSGMMYGAFLALKQRYIYHASQSSGPFEHQNSFGMVINMIFPPTFAIFLVGQGGRFAIATLLSCTLAMVLTLSRGSMTMFVLAAAVVFLWSCKREFTTRKIRVLAISTLGVFAVLLKSIDTITERFLTAPKASEEARVLFKKAAQMMLDDHPLGIGINQYSFVLRYHGYAARLNIDGLDRDGIVHNIYWLTAAELGYLGYIAFLWLIFSPMLLAFRGALRDRSVRGDVLMGLGVALLVTYMQGTLEWALRITQVGQVMWISFGVAAGLYAQTRYAPSGNAG